MVSIIAHVEFAWIGLFSQTVFAIFGSSWWTMFVFPGIMYAAIVIISTYYIDRKGFNQGKISREGDGYCGNCAHLVEPNFNGYSVCPECGKPRSGVRRIIYPKTGKKPNWNQIAIYRRRMRNVAWVLLVFCSGIAVYSHIEDPGKMNVLIPDTFMATFEYDMSNEDRRSLLIDELIKQWEFGDLSHSAREALASRIITRIAQPGHLLLEDEFRVLVSAHAEGILTSEEVAECLLPLMDISLASTPSVVHGFFIVTANLVIPNSNWYRKLLDRDVEVRAEPLLLRVDAAQLMVNGNAIPMPERLLFNKGMSAELGSYQLRRGTPKIRIASNLQPEIDHQISLTGSIELKQQADDEEKTKPSWSRAFSASAKVQLKRKDSDEIAQHAIRDENRASSLRKDLQTYSMANEKHIFLGSAYMPKLMLMHNAYLVVPDEEGQMTEIPLERCQCNPFNSNWGRGSIAGINKETNRGWYVRNPKNTMHGNDKFHMPDDPELLGRLGSAITVRLEPHFDELRWIDGKTSRARVGDYLAMPLELRVPFYLREKDNQDGVAAYVEESP